jgi:chromosome segregation ATPase
MTPANKENPLSGTAKVSVVVLVVSLGIWGCARKPAEKGTAERVRNLEARCLKLEQDYRTVQQARDKAKKELASLEEELAGRTELLKERDALRKQVQSVQAERDDLRQQVSAKASERDALQNRCERLRKGLQNLMTQDDTPVSSATTPTASTPPSAGPALGGQS